MHYVSDNCRTLVECKTIQSSEICEGLRKLFSTLKIASWTDVVVIVIKSYFDLGYCGSFFV